MPLPLVAAGLAGVLVESLPSIASWIFGDKTGKAVEVVTGAAKQVFGTDDPASLERALAADPAKALEFKRLVLEGEANARAHIEAMRQQDVDQLRAELADVQSARQQTVDLAKAGSPIAWGSVVVSLLAIAVFGMFVFLLFSRVLPPGMESRIDLLTGAAITGYSMVLAYWLGSSAGSAAKDTTLRQMTRK